MYQRSQMLILMRQWKLTNWFEWPKELYYSADFFFTFYITLKDTYIELF